ncbi:MAG: SusC/RagA family TonB-linked outer membrane protein, partial [Odoribacter sp.]|nr:SusC/RagA family TonB-linked outer membrane protein [Odoribacter sp.]
NSLNLRWDIVKGLYFTGNANYTMGDRQSDVYVSPEDSRFLRDGIKDEEKGTYNVNGSKNYSWGLSGVVNYSLSLDEDGTVLSLHGGADVSQNGGSSFAFQAVGFSKDRLDNLGFAQGYTKDGAPSGSESYNATVAYFANANFILKDRYFVDFSYRTSGNSVISKDRRWSPYWSAGIGWNIHNERFMAALDWVTSFRFRGSAGYVGSNNFGGTLAQTIYSYGDPYDGYLGALPSQMGNSKLKSQRTLKLNGGVSVDLFDGRLGVNVDFYKEISKDLLMDVNLPTSVGYNTVKYNLGESSNRGYEIAVSGQIIRTRDWGWSLSATTSHTVNKILKISNSLKNINEENRDDNTTVPKIQLEEGESATSIYAVRSAGIDPASGSEIFIKKDGSYTFIYDPKDKVALGNTVPKMQGTISTGVRWKDLTVFAGLSYTFGSYIYNTTRSNKIENISIENNVDRRAFTERWKKVDDYVMYPSVKWPTTTHTERFVERNNELYLSSISISYNLERDWLKKIGLRRLGLGIGFSDILRLSTVKYERGTSYPYMRGYNFTISPTF